MGFTFSSKAATRIIQMAEPFGPPATGFCFGRKVRSEQKLRVQTSVLGTLPARRCEALGYNDTW